MNKISNEIQSLTLKTTHNELGLVRYKIDRNDSEYKNTYYNSIIMDGGDGTTSDSQATTTERTGGLPISSRIGDHDRISFPTPDGVGYTFYITSTSALDTTGGTGATEVYLDGLDANWDRMNETISITGQTSVATTNTNWLRINKFFVSDVGSLAQNQGDILISIVDDAVLGVPQTSIVSAMQLQYGYSTLGIFSVPRFHRLYFTRGSYYTTATTTKYLINQQYSTYPWGGSTLPNDKRIKLSVGGLYSSSSMGYETGGSAPEYPCTDIEFTTRAEIGTIEYSIFWNTVVVKDVRVF